MNAPALDRFLARLLAALVRGRDREMLIGDLEEERALLSASRTPRELSRWYRRQVLRSLAPVIWAAIRRGSWLKTLGAAFLGYIAVAILVILGDVAMSKLMSASSTAYPIVSLVIGFPVMMAGGYVAASMRSGAARALAVMSAVMGLASLLGTGGRAPLWYQIALVFVGPAGSVIGGRIRVARNERTRI